MIIKSMDIASMFPVRKSLKQKKAFRDAVSEYVRNLGYEYSVEKTGLMGCNLIIGDPKTAKHLITAHYDTCAAMFLPNFITPCNFGIYFLYQIVLTLILMLPAFIISVIVFLLTESSAYLPLIFWADLLLTMLFMMYGPANQHNANDNTSGVVTVLEIASSLPEEYRDQVCFVLFDWEEAGLIGSSAYRSAHKKESCGQIIWNFDCVGDGNEIMFFPSRKVKKNPDTIKLLEQCCSTYHDKNVSVCSGFFFYPSDQSNFPQGVGIAALHKGKFALYMDRIHTCKDTVLDEQNINILRDTMLRVIASVSE